MDIEGDRRADPTIRGPGESERVSGSRRDPERRDVGVERGVVARRSPEHEGAARADWRASRRVRARGRGDEKEGEAERDDAGETAHLSTRLDRNVEGRSQVEPIESLDVRVDLPEARARQPGRRNEEVVPMGTVEVLLRFRGTRWVPERELNRAVVSKIKLGPVRVVVQEDREGVHPDGRRIRVRFEVD